MTSFSRSLNEGKVGESVIAGLLRASGYSVLPVYEKEDSEFKGPRLFAPDTQIVAPDMFAYKGNRGVWIEAKHKNAFSWHRNTRRFVTGIDLHHYQEYCRIADTSPWPVWLLFLHRGGIAKDSPESPAGLYGGSLSRLRACESHRHANHGRHGMVYWAERDLSRLCGAPSPRTATFMAVPRLKLLEAESRPAAMTESMGTRTYDLEKKVDMLYATLADVLVYAWEVNQNALG